MGWKSTVFILFLSALIVAVCARNGRRPPENRRGRGSPSHRSGDRGGAGQSQTEANLEQRGGGRGNGGRKNEGRPRPGEQFLNDQGRHGVDGGEGAEFRGQVGFRRGGSKSFIGEGGRREGGRQEEPEGNMSPFGDGRRSDSSNETDNDESFPGRHHGRHHYHHRRRHHHGRRNESEESDEVENNGTSIFPVRFRHHGNRRYHRGKSNDSEEYDDEEDNNGTRFSVFENAPFRRLSRRHQHPCKRNRTEEENSISDRWDRRDQSGRDGERRGEGGNDHSFQRPGKSGRHGNRGGRPSGRRGGRKHSIDDEDISTTTTMPTTQTADREIDEFGTNVPEINAGFIP